MIITCQNCETKFDIPDDKYRPGRKARCSNCGVVFPLPELEIPASPPEVEIPEATNAVKDDISAIPPKTSMDGKGGELPDDDSLPDQTPVRKFQDSFEDVVSPIAEAPAPAPKRSKKKFSLLILGIVLALALLSYGGIMVYSVFFQQVKSSDPVKASDDDVVNSLGGRTGGAEAEKEAARQAAVSRLVLEGVRQQTVSENAQTGPMVVIEGMVVNNFETPRDLILLEITLYDSKGNALVMREQYCGVTLSLLQLRTLSKEALESALSNQVDILTNNANIPPGGKVPFSTVFFDFPNTAYEFEVKVIDVQDPSPKK